MRLSRFVLTCALVALSACAGGGNTPSAPPGAGTSNAALAPHTDGTMVAQSSPYNRVFPNGQHVHIYPVPSLRATMVQNSHRGAYVNYNGGQVIDYAQAYAIYWRPAGSYMSPKYMSTITRFLRDLGSTPTYEILTQYSDHDGHIQNATTVGGRWIDARPYPANMDDSSIQDEVKRAIAFNHWPSGGYRALYFVFTAAGAPVSFGYCAYHGAFGSKAAPVVYSLMPYQHDISSSGCGTPTTVFPNDEDSDQTIDTLYHEYAEAATDPNLDAWWWSSGDGSEVGDLCNSAYSPRRSDGSDVTLHGDNYINQEVWSNSTGECKQTWP